MTQEEQRREDEELQFLTSQCKDLVQPRAGIPGTGPRKLSNTPGAAGCGVGGTASTPRGTLAGCA